MYRLLGDSQEKAKMGINKNILRIAFATALLLLVPLVAMQFTDEVDWSIGDFVTMGALLFGTGLAYELVSRKAGNGAYRFAIGVALVAALLLVWVNLAVGIIGSEDNPANVMYAGVLYVLIIGTFIARLQPQGMARTLFATALAQAMVPVIALIIWGPEVTSEEGSSDLLHALGANVFFVMLFVGSALLFRRATVLVSNPQATA